MLLENIHEPSDIKKLNIKQLRQLAEELRTEIIRVVSDRGGHLASNLGMVELTIAMHYVFDTPTDKLIFDVGHQCYAHKLLTGRYDSFQRLRGLGGASGFPQMEESEYDAFTAGHASTAISAALGIARTRDIMKDDFNVVALVGDGALTGGMCYEALNDAGQNGTRLIVILNDNAMSISRNVGAMSNYLTRMRQSRTYRGIKRGIRRGLEHIPRVGMPIFRFLERFRDFLKSLFVDGKFFDALGFYYIGPIDGHDLKHLIRVLKRSRETQEPMLIHAVTQKGRGYRPAEAHPDQYHGVAPFLVESGESRREQNGISMGSIAAWELAQIAENDIRICAVSAAMTGGTGMETFQETFPDRFFDVGIAEEHAVTMAAGMASQGMKPYVAIYSTFLQRAYDQITMDVCRNSLPVTFLIDRAGLVGPDGATHQGVFDLSYLRSIPNLVIAAPRDVRDLKKLVVLSAEHDGPMAIRYPKNGEDLGPGIQAQQDFTIGEWELLSSGTDVMIFAVGRMVQLAMQATIELMGKGVSAGVVDARFVKPMDERMLIEQSARARLVVTIEENVLSGGFGEGVLDVMSRKSCSRPTLTLGVPDRFVSHAGVSRQLEECGLSAMGITHSIYARWREITGGTA